MKANSEVRIYGVKEQCASGTDLDRNAEMLCLLGYTIVDGGYSAGELAHIAAELDRVHAVQAAANGGLESLRAIDEHNTIRAPLSLSDTFIELASNKRVHMLLERIFHGSAASGAYVLNQQNGIINPGNSEHYNQGSYHRDLPYQHYVSTRPLAINALFCIDAFTTRNGATLVMPGSHKQESCPSKETLANLAVQAEAPAGSFLVLDCMVYHSGGVNTTANPRRAVNHVFTTPFIKPQVELPSVLGARADLSDATRRLLGYGYEVPRSVEGYYDTRRAKLRTTS